MDNSFKKMLDKLAQRPKVVERYVPRFSIGDYILTKYKDQTLIAIVKSVNSNEDDKQKGNYILQTLYNNKPVKRRYDRPQIIQVIDKYYNIINPETARVLYDIELVDINEFLK